MISTGATAITVGPIGRLGRWTADHRRAVGVVWALLAVGLGIFAPRAEHALSGAGWEANGSESVAARDEVDPIGDMHASADYRRRLVFSEAHSAISQALSSGVGDLRHA